MSLAVAKDGWLSGTAAGTEVVRFPTVRTVPLDLKVPVALVWHGTGGRGGAGFAEGLARRIATYRRGVDRPASWHCLIGRDGQVLQSASLKVGTWHVGLPGLVEGTVYPQVNRVTVGVELENAGRLREIAGHLYCWPYFSNPGAPAHERRPNPKCRVAATRAVAARAGQLFDAITPAQERAATEVVRCLAAVFGWRRSAGSYTHRMLAPARKEDPGALWETVVMPRVLDAVFGEAQLSDEATEPDLVHAADVLDVAEASS